MDLYMRIVRTLRIGMNRLIWQHIVVYVVQTISYRIELLGMLVCHT